MVVVHDRPLYQLDMKNIFLDGDREDEAYVMEQSYDLVARGGYAGCVGFYMVRNSFRAWFGKFNSIIQEFGMTRGEANHVIFYRICKSVHLFGCLC